MSVVKGDRYYAGATLAVLEKCVPLSNNKKLALTAPAFFNLKCLLNL